MYAIYYDEFHEIYFLNYTKSIMIFKNISIVLTSSVIIQSLAFLSLYFVANYLGPEVLGSSVCYGFVGF